jgi:hypothetical protein
MSSQDVEIEVINIGAVGTASRGLFRVPKASGGITILGAYVECGAAATATMQLNSLGTALGTAISSNIGTLNGTMVANVRQAMTISTGYVTAGEWVGFATVTGITDTVTLVIVEYKYGK